MGRRAPKTGRGLAAKRRGRGKLRPNARHARGCARQRAWAAVCLRRAKDGVRVVCKSVCAVNCAQMRVMHAWVRADDSAHGRCYACGVRQRRGAGWLQSGVGTVNCAQMQTASKRASCTGMSKTARMGRGAPVARPGFARRGMTGITRLCPLVAESRAPVRHGKGVPMATALCHKKARGCA